MKVNYITSRKSCVKLWNTKSYYYVTTDQKNILRVRNYNLITLCNCNSQFKNEWNKILDTASFRIRDKIIKALNKEIASVQRKLNENHTSIKNKSSKEN